MSFATSTILQRTRDQADTKTSDFRKFVEGGWEKVDPNIRRRMDHLLTANQTVTFKGNCCMRRTKIGFLFAKLSALFGSPLVSEEHESVVSTVSIVPLGNGLRCWHRLFEFPNGIRQTVKTTKSVAGSLGVIDALGKGDRGILITRMRVWATGCSLRFESQGYFIRIGSMRLRMPILLTPGTFHAEHEDLDGEKFRYTLSFRHPLWGETFRQEGIFKQISDDL